MTEQLVDQSWYQKMIAEIKVHTQVRIVEAKHYLGKRIEEEKERGSEWGDHFIDQVVEDLQTSKTDINACRQFYRQHNQLTDSIGQLSWYYITHKLLPSPKKRKFQPPPPPEGRYDAIVVDPPWPVQIIQREVRPNQISMPYPIMTIQEIEEIEIPANDSCHLFLWTTHKWLPSSFAILSSWTFKYVCTFTWHKPGGFQPVGLPQYNCEFILYARRGTPVFRDTKNFPVCFEAPRGRHSEKPDYFYEMVARVTGESRLNMFARKEREGFKGWGEEL